MKTAVARAVAAAGCLHLSRAFTSQVLPHQLCEASIGIVRLPEEKDVDYRTTIIANILPSELEYIYARTENKSGKRIKQFIGGRKALREVVSAELSQMAVPPIFNNMHGAPELPESSHLMCSISHKENFAIAAAKPIHPLHRRCKLGK